MRYFIASVLCAAFWASTGIFIKLLGGLGVNGILFSRFLFAGLLALVAVLVLRPRRDAVPVAQRLGLAALMVLYYVCATYGFYLAPVAVVTLLVSTAPLFTLMIRRLSGKPVLRRELFGFALAFIGLAAYFMQKAGLPHLSGQGFWIGSTLGLLAALLRAVYSSLLRSYQQRGLHMSSMLGNAEILLTGALLTAPLVWFDGVALTWSWSMLWALSGLIVLGTFLPNLLNSFASTHLDATLHNIIGMATPLLVSIMSWYWLGEKQTAGMFVAMLVAMAGIALVVVKPQITGERA